MLRRALALVALLTLIPLVLASGASPPEGATPVAPGSSVAYHWLGNASAVAPSVEPGADALLNVAALMDRSDANATAIVWYVNATSDSLAFPNASAVLRKEYSNVTTSEAYHFASFAFRAPDSTGTYAYRLSLDQYAETNGTLVALQTANVTGEVVVATAEVPAPPAGIPTTWIIAGAAVLVVGAAAGAFGMRQRAIRRRMNEGPRRSQVMRELELEKRMEKAKAPEHVAEIKQEIRQAEQVREKRRELQILEARRADALKTIDLLRRRHESGGLTKLQFDNMVAKKQADLVRIEAEIAQMEREDAGAAA